MLSKKMTDSFNEQINWEIFSSYLYLGMSSYAAHEGYAGIANWFNIQVKEELTHAQMMYDYVIQQGGRVILKEVKKPEQGFDSAEELFALTLEHEKTVTGKIHALLETARKEKDHASEIFLQWFVTEQVEEEANASDILGKFKMMGPGGSGLYMIDSELAKRVFNPPQAL